MEDLQRMMQQVQEENNNFKNVFERLQLASNSVVPPYTPSNSTPFATKEP